MNDLVSEKDSVKTITTTPATLLQMAVSQNADIDKLEKLMDLQQRWEDAEAKKAYTVAMASFRSTCPPIDKDKKGHNTKYASLAHTIDLIKDPLSTNGLSHSWKTDQKENGLIVVTCCVTHKLGYQECTTLSAQGDTTGSKNAIQAIGSSITYLQRYTLFAILGLASSDQDDDGAKAITHITPDQAMNIEALFGEVGGDKQKFLNNFKADAFESIPAQQFKRAIHLLEQKRKS